MIYKSKEKSLSRTCVRFLMKRKSGMFRQKALDLDAPPAPPRYIFLKIGRSIEETLFDSEEEDDSEEENDSDDGEEMLETDIDVKEGEDAATVDKSDENMGNFGDK